MRWRRLSAVKVALGAALFASLLLPASGQATLTIGSSLANPSTASINCGGCTYAQITLPAGAPAPGGVFSPVRGSVVLWRVRTSAGAQTPLAFRVIRPVGNQFTGIATSQSVTPPPSTVTPYAVSIPIEIGDVIGINCCAGVFGDYFRLGGMGAARQWAPPLLDGTTRAPTDTNATYELLVNAEIEPTSAFTLGKPKPRNGGKVKIVATLPNPGTLVAGAKQDKGVGAAAAVKPLKRTTRTATAPGELTFKVKPTKATRLILAGGATKKVKIKVAFTPVGGTASVQTIKAKLRG
jgi:hypothetical protein